MRQVGREMERTLRFRVPLLVAGLALATAACAGIRVDQAPLTTRGSIRAFITEFKSCFLTFGGGTASPFAGVAESTQPNSSFEGMLSAGMFHAEDPTRGSIRTEGGRSGAAAESLADVAVDPVRVGQAERVLRHPLVYRIARILDAAGGHRNEVSPSGLSSRGYLSIPRGEIRSFTRNLRETPLDAFVHLAASLQATNRVGASDMSDVEARIVAYVKAYYSAYFRGGDFWHVQVDLKVLYDQLEKKLQALYGTQAAQVLEKLAPVELRKYVRDEVLAKYASMQDYIEKVLKIAHPGADRFGFSYGREGETKFVSSSGMELQAPFVEFRFDPTKPLEEALPEEIDIKQVGADVIRIFVEAICDGFLGTPAVPAATGANLQNRNVKLRKYDSVVHTQVTVQEYALLKRYADEVDASVGTAVGQAVRGGGPIALNNEALAVVVETVLATVARKITEKAIWCAAWHLDLSIIPTKSGTFVTPLDEADRVLSLGGKTAVQVWDLELR